MRILHKMIKIYTLTAFVMLYLSACSVNIAAPVELLSKPKLNSDQQFVTELIMSIIPHDAYIARPVKSNNLNSVGFIDVDGDGVNEIYAFYVDKNTNNVGLILVYHDETQWKLLTNLRLIGSDIAYSDFVDCDGDNVKEFIIGTTSEEQIHKNLYIARYEQANFDVIYRDFYTEIIIDDFDQDLIADIAMFKLDRNNFAYAEILDFEQEEIKIVAKTELDPYISGYYNVAYDNLEKGKKAFILDFETGSKSATNILKYEKNKLIKAFDSFESDTEYKKTLKLSPIKSQDIDDDGVVEIANNFKINTNSGEPKISSGFVIWNNYVEDQFHIKKVFFWGDRNHLKMEFPRHYIDALLESKLELVDYIFHSKSYKIDFYMDLGNMSSKWMSLNKMTRADFNAYLERKRASSREETFQNELSENIVHPQGVENPEEVQQAKEDEAKARALLEKDLQEEFAAFKEGNQKIKSWDPDLAILELEIPSTRDEVFFIDFYDLDYEEVSYLAKDVLYSIITRKFDAYHDQNLSKLLEQLEDFIQTIDFM